MGISIFLVGAGGGISVTVVRTVIPEPGPQEWLSSLTAIVEGRGERFYTNTQ